ncbi:MAG: hypothetical protein BWX81_01359 [Spirochaetes bacterium ADurb.Bin110]|nr:MAG: hypothetical protein BWX81_01359 [Spirochaetes bacterium ADurb.Bin110]
MPSNACPGKTRGFQIVGRYDHRSIEISKKSAPMKNMSAIIPRALLRVELFVEPFIETDELRRPVGFLATTTEAFG